MCGLREKLIAGEMDKRRVSMDKRRRVSVCGDAPSGTAVDENTVPTARVSICSYCDKSFSTPQHLRQHTEYSHATQCYPAAAVPGATGAARAASGSGVAPGVRRWDDELLHKMAVGRVNQHCPRDLAAAIKDHFAHTVATFKEQVGIPGAVPPTTRSGCRFHASKYLCSMRGPYSQRQ